MKHWILLAIFLNEPKLIAFRLCFMKSTKLQLKKKKYSSASKSNNRPLWKFRPVISEFGDDSW